MNFSGRKSLFIIVLSVFALSCGGGGGGGSSSGGGDGSISTAGGHSAAGSAAAGIQSQTIMMSYDKMAFNGSSAFSAAATGEISAMAIDNLVTFKIEDMGGTTIAQQILPQGETVADITLDNVPPTASYLAFVIDGAETREVISPANKNPQSSISISPITVAVTKILKIASPGLSTITPSDFEQIKSGLLSIKTDGDIRQIATQSDISSDPDVQALVGEAQQLRNDRVPAPGSISNHARGIYIDQNKVFIRILEPGRILIVVYDDSWREDQDFPSSISQHQNVGDVEVKPSIIAYAQVSEGKYTKIVADLSLDFDFPHKFFLQDLLNQTLSRAYDRNPAGHVPVDMGFAGSVTYRAPSNNKPYSEFYFNFTPLLTSGLIAANRYDFHFSLMGTRSTVTEKGINTDGSHYAKKEQQTIHYVSLRIFGEKGHICWKESDCGELASGTVPELDPNFISQIPEAN